MDPPRRKQKEGVRRKRIDTARRIENPAARQVAFSKRRSTLFNMAGDLSALCGVHTSVVAFSSSTRGNAYAFGSPSVDAVLARLAASRNKDQDDGAGALAAIVEEEDEEDAATFVALRQELQDTQAHVEAEKERIKAVEAGVKRAMEAARMTRWWLADVNALGAAELPEFKVALRRLKDAALRHVDAMHADQNGQCYTTTGMKTMHTLYLNN